VCTIKILKGDLRIIRSSGVGAKDEQCRFSPQDVPGTLRVIPCQLALLAMCVTTIKASRRRQLKLASWDGGFLG
jgi:hypothetical protein